MPILLPKNLNDLTLTCLDPSDSRGGVAPHTHPDACKLHFTVCTGVARSCGCVGGLLGLDGRGGSSVSPCVIRVSVCARVSRVRPCVPCVSRLPPVSF